SSDLTFKDDAMANINNFSKNRSKGQSLCLFLFGVQRRRNIELLLKIFGKVFWAVESYLISYFCHGELTFFQILRCSLQSYFPYKLKRRLPGQSHEFFI